MPFKLLTQGVNMKINNISAGGNYSSKLNFKSAFIVDPGPNPHLNAGIPIDYDSLFSFDNSKTEELYRVIKSKEGEKISLFHYGDIAQFPDTAKPEIVLIDDEVSADAHSHIELKNEYQQSMQSLEKKTPKELKKMLTKKEFKSVQPQIDANPKGKLEILKNAVAKSLRNTFRLKEEQLYSSLVSKVKTLKPEDISKFKFIA